MRSERTPPEERLGRIRTVADLIWELRAFPATAPILGTWEGINATIDVFRTPSGTVLVDVDGDSYRDEFESGRRPIIVDR